MLHFKFLTKKNSLIVLASLGCLLIYVGSRWLDTLTPESVLTSLFDMNEPTRYVFVVDATQPHIAVVDLLTKQQINTIVTETIAEILALNKYSGQLAYAERGGNTVYLYDITTHEKAVYDVNFPIQSLLFKPDSTTLMVVGKENVLLTQSDDWTQQTLYDGFGDIRSLHYSPLSEEVWFVDEGMQQIVYYQLNQQVFSTYALPINWQHYSQSALSPDGEYLFFGVQNTDDNSWLAVVWQTSTQQVLAKHLISSPLIQPYIDINSQNFVALDAAGQGVHFVVNDFDNPQTFQSIEQPSVSALGWMDSKLFVGGVQAVALHELNDIANPKIISITSKVVDLFITADSKTALFLQADSTALYGFDFHKGILNQVDLRDIKQPSQLIMGAGHTLCH